MPFDMPARVAARIAAFIPGASPPEVRMPTLLIFESIVKMLVVESEVDTLIPL